MSELKDRALRILSDATGVAWNVAQNSGGQENKAAVETVPILKSADDAAQALRTALHLKEEEAERLVRVHDNKLRVFLGAFSEGNLRILRDTDIKAQFSPNVQNVRLQ